MKESTIEHVFPLTPERLMQLIDEDPYRDFLLARIPGLAGYERLDLRWEGDRRVRRTRMKFEVPLPELLRRALPSTGDKGWMEETNILYPKERRMESTMVSSIAHTVRVVHFHPGMRPRETRRVTHSTMEAKVPLVGRALEKFMAREADKHRDTEFEATLAYLRENPVE